MSARKPSKKTIKQKSIGPVSKSADAPVNSKVKHPGSGTDLEPGTPSRLRRKEFVARVAGTSGLKPNVIKSVLDAVLQELGAALSAGEGVDLQPLGKITVIRHKKLADKEILTCKIRRKLPASDSAGHMDTAAE